MYECTGMYNCCYDIYYVNNQYLNWIENTVLISLYTTY